MTRILTVDDSRAVRTIIGKTLRANFDILEAEDGEKGLAVLQEETVDLVLLDVTMPVMDGPEMLKRLRERGDQTPVGEVFRHDHAEGSRSVDARENRHRRCRSRIWCHALPHA